MAMMRDLVELNATIQEEKERIDTVDSKIVSFSLSGKDYGVDIMNVKEIAKADKFTYVPNVASFVKGVYNLRGDIIPIIDLRTFFHLPIEKKKDGLENMLILRIGDRVYGTIVDKIDKVVGINSETVQPPHPIFGDINIKYISGVVEKNGDLYIILDVIRIFSQTEVDKQKGRSTVTSEDIGGAVYSPPPAEVQGFVDSSASESAISFIKESLPVLRNFHPNDINDEWIRKRFAEWSETRSGDDLQLKDAIAADDYLSTFYSPDTGHFWSDDYASQVKALLPTFSSNNIQVWNPGCGKGYESFSFACILRSRYPSGNIKIWANDNDIMAISQAPSMVFDLEDVPEYCRAFMVKGRHGHGFNQVIKDSIVFEYHDVLHDSPLPDLDIILARDLLSFIGVSDQENLMAVFSEKLKTRGIVFVGRNEYLSENEWRFIGKDPVPAFMKN
jgi:purine-binding chemotaxis protein CheW